MLAWEDCVGPKSPQPDARILLFHHIACNPVTEGDCNMQYQAHQHWHEYTVFCLLLVRHNHNQTKMRENPRAVYLSCLHSLANKSPERNSLVLNSHTQVHPNPSAVNAAVLSSNLIISLSSRPLLTLSPESFKLQSPQLSCAPCYSSSFSNLSHPHRDL